MTENTDATARPAVGSIRTPDEHADLLSYHKRRIEEAMAGADAAKEPVKAAKALLTVAQEEVTKRFNAAKADLGRGYTREYLASLIEDGRRPVRELVEIERRRAKDKADLGQPVFGIQAELFPGEETPTAARDEMAWEAEGYLRGLRGDLEELKDSDPPAFHQAILRGVEKGQHETQERFLRAQEKIKARETPNAGAAPVTMPEPEPGTPEHKAKEREAIRRAKAGLDRIGKPVNEEPA